MEYNNIDTLKPKFWKIIPVIHKLIISIYKSSLTIDHLQFKIHNNNLEIIHKNSLNINKIQTYKTNNIMSNNEDNNSNSSFSLDNILNNSSQIKIFNQIIKTQINFKIQAKVFLFLKVYLLHRIQDIKINHVKMFKSQFNKHLVDNIIDLINDLFILFEFSFK